MFREIPEAPPGTVGFRLEGRLTREDYRLLAPILERSLDQEGGLAVLLDLSGFQGLAVRFGVMDLVRGRKYNRKLKRLAVLDDGLFAEWFTLKAARYLSAEVRAFAPGEEERAWEWITEG